MFTKVQAKTIIENAATMEPGRQHAAEMTVLLDLVETAEAHDAYVKKHVAYVETLRQDTLAINEKILAAINELKAEQDKANARTLKLARVLAKLEGRSSGTTAPAPVETEKVDEVTVEGETAPAAVAKPVGRPVAGSAAAAPESPSSTGVPAQDAAEAAMNAAIAAAEAEKKNHRGASPQQ